MTLRACCKRYIIEYVRSLRHSLFDQILEFFKLVICQIGSISITEAMIQFSYWIINNLLGLEVRTSHVVTPSHLLGLQILEKPMGSTDFNCN